jgi:hypothetical protein
MKTKIKINDIGVFNKMITSVSKIVQDAKFIFTKDGDVKVNVINSAQTIRAFFTAKGIVEVDEEIEFCFKDILTLKKSIDLISKFECCEDAVLDFDGTFISYKNEVKFKLKAVKSEIIEQYITTEIKTKLEPVFSFNTTDETIKQVVQCSNIVNNPDAKIYISKNKENIIAEVDDAQNKMSNSIAVPISDDFDGEIGKPVALTVENFLALNTLKPLDEINVTYTDKSVFEVRVVDDTDFIELYMIITTVKG